MAPEPEILTERAPTSAEATAFLRVLEAHVLRLRASLDEPRPVVLASYDGTRRQPNLTALLGLLLKRYGVTVCIHGAPWGGSPLPMTTAAVLLELGIEPATDLGDAQARLAHDNIAYVPIEVLAPDLSRLQRASGSDFDLLVPALVRLLDPFGGDGYRVIGARTARERAWMHDVLVSTQANALLLAGTEGEPFADPVAPPRFESFTAGVASDSESEVATGSPPPSAAGDAVATAAAIERVLLGELPVPDSILAQLGCCLAGVRR